MLGFLLMAAVSYDSSNPNEVLEEELKKLNSNLERLISITEMNLLYANELVETQNKIQNRIFLSLQPNAFDVNGELIDY